jgi:hypothetical protein
MPVLCYPREVCGGVEVCCEEVGARQGLWKWKVGVIAVETEAVWSGGWGRGEGGCACRGDRGVNLVVLDGYETDKRARTKNEGRGIVSCWLCVALCC